MSTINWDEVATIANDAVKFLGPIAAAAVPGSAAAIAIATQIIQGVVAAEPAAIALYNQITSGTDVTPDQLQAYIADNEASYAELQAAIALKLAQTP